MFIVLAIIQFILGLIIVIGVFFIDSYSAPQQTVQYIQLLIGSLFIVGGIVTFTISHFSKLILEKISEKNDFTTRDSVEESEKGKENNEVVISTEIEKNGYELIQVNGKILAKVKDSTIDNYYCPNCYTQTNPTFNACMKCGKKFSNS